MLKLLILLLVAASVLTLIGALACCYAIGNLCSGKGPG